MPHFRTTDDLLSARRTYSQDRRARDTSTEETVSRDTQVIDERS